MKTVAMERVVRVACLVIALSYASESASNPAAGNACLSGICVGDALSTEREVVKRLGGGIRIYRPDDVGASRCYFDAGTGVWADFTFAGKEESSAAGDLRGIMLTKQRICEGRTGEPRMKLGGQLAGAAIGMTESEVLASRGPPIRIDDAGEREGRKPAMADTRYAAKFGARVYVYERPNDLGFTFVYFRDGRVRTIWFSASE